MASADTYGFVYHTNQPYNPITMKMVKLEDIILNKEVYIGVTNGYDHWYTNAKVVEICPKIQLQGAYTRYIAEPNEMGYLAIVYYWAELPPLVKTEKLNWQYGF